MSTQWFYGYIMNSFKERLNELLCDYQISRLKLAKIIGSTSTTINGYFNKNYYPTINIAIKISNYFKCSLDYLFGISDAKYTDETNDNLFIDNFHFLIKQNNISVARTMRDMNMSEANYYRWRRGLFPKTNNLITITEYFSCSLDFLVGGVKI